MARDRDYDLDSWLLAYSDSISDVRCWRRSATPKNVVNPDRSLRPGGRGRGDAGALRFRHPVRGSRRLREGGPAVTVAARAAGGFGSAFAIGIAALRNATAGPGGPSPRI